MKQIQIDFARGDQLGLIDAIQFGNAGAVSGTATKAVLRAVDSFGRECFATVPTIAARANCSERVAKRALSRLVELSIITRERKTNVFGVVTNHYRIVWSEMQLMVDRQLSAVRGAVLPVPVCPPPARTIGPRRPTIGPRRPTVGPLATERRAIMAHNTQEEQINRHQTAREAAAECFDFSEEGAKELRSLFESIGLKRASAFAAEFRCRAADVKAAVEVFLAQRRLFENGGAVIDFLRSGCWPVDGVKSLVELEDQRQRERERRELAKKEREEMAARRSDAVGGFSEQELEILRRFNLA